MGLDVTPSRRGPAVQVTVGGVPVRVFGSFWITAMVVIADRSPSVPSLAWAAILLAVVLAVEGGHAWALARLGFAPRIWLRWLGGETFVAATRPVGVARLVGAYLAGPICGFALAGAADFAHRLHPAPWLHALGAASAAWAACHLLPIQPMSGGKILLALVTRPLGERAKTTTHVLSLAFIAALAVLCARGPFNLTALALLLLAAVSNITALREAFLTRWGPPLTPKTSNPSRGPFN